MIREAIETLLTGTDLEERRAAAVMEEIMDGAPHAALVSAYLVALRAKGESVPELVGSARVMRHLAAISSQAFPIRSSSVAIQTSSTEAARHTCSYTCCMRYLPVSLARGFPGKRDEAKRAGITATIFT